MSPELDPQKHRDRAFQDWEELSRRLDRAATPSSPRIPVEGGAQLTLLSVPASDPHGVEEVLDAMRAAAIERWECLVLNYPYKHFFQAEVPFRIMFKPEGIAEQQKINLQKERITEWLRTNLQVIMDYNVESSGVSSDFHLFFKTAEIYQRFCDGTGERMQHKE